MDHCIVPKQYRVWPSLEGGFTVYVIPPEPNRIKCHHAYQSETMWAWYVDFEDSYLGGTKKTEQKAIVTALKAIATMFGADIKYVRELMEYEALMYALASIGE